MVPRYEDIRALAPDCEPLWHDHYGVPRYAPFHPSLLDVYARWAVLYEIECDACRQRLMVGQSWSEFDFRPLLPRRIAVDNLIVDLHYGDPPYHECPGAGESMNCNDLRVVEFWRRERITEWKRDPSREKALNRE